jgi:Domain of unknown function (DUF4410)
MNNYVRIIVPMVAAVLAACGTTSELRPAASEPETVGAASPAQKPNAELKTKPAVDLSGYDRVVVLDFIDGTDTSKLKPEQVRTHNEVMAGNLHVFSDLIARKIRESGAYSEVERQPVSGKALVVSGRVTRLVEGNGTLRLLIGMGAGSSYFDASVQLSDSETDSVLASATTGNNSWVLGGGLAATQTVASFMDLSATRIAARLRDGKKGPAPTSSVVTAREPVVRAAADVRANTR